MIVVIDKFEDIDWKLVDWKNIFIDKYLEKIDSFAVQTAPTHYNPDNRPPCLVEKHITMGKTGECYAFEAAKSIDIPNLPEINFEDNKKGDVGWDIKFFETKVDVKTSPIGYYAVNFPRKPNIKNYKCDYLLFLGVNGNKVVEFIGYCDPKEMITKGYVQRVSSNLDPNNPDADYYRLDKKYLTR